MAAMMQSLVQALAWQQRQQSSSDSSDSDLAEEVFEEAPLPPLPAISPLAEDLAISSSEDEALPISGRCSPAFPEVSRVAEDTSQPEEVSFPDLLSHPPPATEGDLSMPAIEAVSEAPPPVAPVVPGPPSAEPAAAKDITLLVPSSENVTPQSILYRPLGSQAMIFREKEGGEVSGSFILDGEHFGTIVFMDDRLCSFRIPSKLLIRHMSHVLHRCSFSPFSMETKVLQPFEHCVLLKQAFSTVVPRVYQLFVAQEKDVTVFKSPEDYDSYSIVKKTAERVVESFKGYFSKLPIFPKPKDKTRVSVQAAGPLADYLDAPLLDISRMHREDNIQAIVSTPRPSLVLEE